MKKKLLITLLSITLLTGCSSKQFFFEYSDMAEPGSKYEVWVNYKEKSLRVKETNYCSTLDCESTETDNTITLTKEEIELIKTIESSEYNEESLSIALSSLAKDETKVISEGEDWWDDFKVYDINKDGTVTRREVGLTDLRDLAGNQ